MNAQVKCDIVTLDSGLDGPYIKLLAEGKKLTLKYNTCISQYQTIPGQTYFSINITRSLTRLKYVCLSLWKDYAAAPRTTIVGSRQWNGFYSPSASDTEGAYDGVGEYVNPYDPAGEFEYRMQIGSKLYPEYPIRSHATAYYQLRKTHWDINHQRFKHSL